MEQLLSQLPSNEAILLMYLAGELSAEEQARVEDRLQSDSALRAELENIREVHGIISNLTALDIALNSTSAASNAAEQAARRFGREIRQRQLQIQTPAASASAHPRRRMAMWAYPFAVAAAVLLGFLAWWGNQPSHQQIVKVIPSAVAVDANHLLPEIQTDFETDAPLAAAQRHFDALEDDAPGLPIPPDANRQ